MWELNEELPEPLSENGATDEIWWAETSRSGDLEDMFPETLDKLDSQESEKAAETAFSPLESFGLEENSKTFKSRFAKTQSQILSPSNIGLGIDLTVKMPNARRPLPSWPDRYQNNRAQTVSPCEEGDDEEGDDEDDEEEGGILEYRRQSEHEPHTDLVRSNSAESGGELRGTHHGGGVVVQKPVVNLDPPTPPQPPVAPPLASDCETAPVSPLKDRSPRLPQRSKIVGPSYNNTKNLTLAKRSFTTSAAISKYRVGDDRQVSRRPPLWKRRVSHKGSFPQTKSEMLAATHSSHGYDLSTVNELMGYPTLQEESSSLIGKDISQPDHLPLSPPLSSARSSFLLPSNSTASQSSSNLYSLSSESLSAFNEGNPPNTLSRPHSMPHLQDQPNCGYDQPRHYLQHQQSHEYLSRTESFEDDSDKAASFSAYSSFSNPFTISETMDLDASDTTSNSGHGSSPQTWWDQNVNIELAQDEAMAYASQPSSATFHPLQAQTLPTKCQTRFQQATGHDSLTSPLLYLQQPRSPIAEHEKLYADLMHRTHSNHSSIPSPPGSPAYYFSPDLGEGYAPSPQAVQFVDPFQQAQHNQQQRQAENQQSQQQQQQQQRHSQQGPVLRSNAGHYDLRSQPTVTTRSRGMTTSSLASSMSSSSAHPPSPRPYSRKCNTSVPSSRRPSVHSLSKGTSAAARAAAAAAATAADPKEVSFVNFTPHDATKILSGVAPSGSSKTKARREREALERRRKLSEAAAAAVLAAGGDPSNIPLDF